MSELLKFVANRNINISWFDVFEFILDIFSFLGFQVPVRKLVQIK